MKRINKKHSFNIFKEIKYLKNTLIIKINILKKRKNNGCKLNFIDILKEFGIKINLNKKSYNKNPSKNNKKNSLNPPLHYKKEIKDFRDKQLNIELNKSKYFITICNCLLIIIISYMLSLNTFVHSNNIDYYNLIPDNEGKILSVLKSPKTTVYTNRSCVEKNGEVIIEEYFDIVDSLDSYLYRIKSDSISSELKNEILKSNYLHTKNIKDLSQLKPKTITEYENYYIINNSYNIEKNSIPKDKIKIAKRNIDVSMLNEYNTNKKNTVYSTTFILSIIFNLVVVTTKRGISKN